MTGVNAEYVPEYAKEKVWKKNFTALNNQIYIFGKQYYHITQLGDADAVVTDSAITLSEFYLKDKNINIGRPFCEMVRAINNDMNTLNFLVKRVLPFNPKGRYQTEEQSDVMAPMIDFVKSLGINYITINGDADGYTQAGKIVMDRYSKMK